MRHITFDSIDCNDLQYVRPADSWVCLRYYCDLHNVDTCMQCRFKKLLAAENKERKNYGCKK